MTMDRALTIRKSDLSWLLGSALAEERKRLATGTSNRTLLILTRDLINRVFLEEPAPIPRAVCEGAQLSSESTRQLLSQIKDSPTSAELADLGLVDAFFKGVYLLNLDHRTRADGVAIPITEVRYPSSRVRVPHRELRVPILDFICNSAHAKDEILIISCGDVPLIVPGSRRQSYTSIVSGALAKNPFFCPPRPRLPGDILYAVSIQAAESFFFDGPVGFYNLNTFEPWSDMKPVVTNIINIQKVIVTYPFPQMFLGTRGAAFWWGMEMVALRDLVRHPGVLTEDLARLWITLSIVRDWGSITDHVTAELRREAREARFDAMIQAIAFAAIGAVAGLAAIPLLVKGIAVGGAVISEVQKRETAKGLSDAAEKLHESDPAFAGEVQWSAQYIQQMLNEASRPAGTPAPGQGGALEAVVGIGLPTLISVGISILGKR